MALSRLKTNRIHSATKKLLKHKNTSLQISKHIKSVGIIVNEGSDFNFELLKKMQNKFSISSNYFYVLTCKNTTESFNEFRGVTVQEQDFSWNGILKSPEVIEFLEKPVDMLIDFTNNEKIYNNFLVAKSNANFKVGFTGNDERLYDLMITSTSIALFIDELVKYLRILNKM